jgi:hypothetical protein
MPPSSWFQRNHFGTFDAVGWGHPPHQFTVTVEIVLANGRRLRGIDGLSASGLAQLIRVLESA